MVKNVQFITDCEGHRTSVKNRVIPAIAAWPTTPVLLAKSEFGVKTDLRGRLLQLTEGGMAELICQVYALQQVRKTRV